MKEDDDSQWYSGEGDQDYQYKTVDNKDVTWA
jgi:hypothetical protein